MSVLTWLSGAWTAMRGAFVGGGGGQTAAQLRETLTPGTDLPTTTTTGALPDVARTVHLYPNDGNGRYYQMSPGEHIENFILHGGLEPAAGCSAYNGEILGWVQVTLNTNTQYGLVNLESGAVSDFLCEHVDLIPETPSPAFTGVRGSGGLFRFVDVAFVQDGSMAFALNNSTVPILSFYYSLFRRPLITNPDPTRSDGDSTHADVGCQVEGAGMDMDGVFIDAWDVNTDGPFATAELNNGGIAGLMFTGNRTSLGDRPHFIRFTRGWVRGGTVPVNMTSTTSKLPAGGIEITNSKLSLGLHNYGGGSPYKHMWRPSAYAAQLDLTGTVSWDFDTMTSDGGLVIGNG